MKVLHINSYYLIRPLHQTMIEHLDQTGVVSDVMAHTSSDVVPVIKPRENVHILPCFSKMDKPFFFLKQWKIFYAAKQEFSFQDYDFTHSYSLFSSGYCSYSIKKRYGIPYVVAIRDTDVNVFLKYKPYLKGIGYRILDNASRIFFLSPEYQNEVLNELVPSKDRARIIEKSEVIPNGIDDYWLDNLNYNRLDQDSLGGTIRILFVGELIKRKNLPKLIEAVNILCKQGSKIHLTVIGKKTDETIYNQIKNLDYVEYHEPMPKEELIHYYRKNDVFVLPSLTETFGLVYAEAMSQALPVLYTKGQGFDGQFKDGQVGYSIDANDANDIVNKIKMTMENYNKLSHNCLTSVVKFSWDHITQRYSKIYCDLKENFRD